MTSLKARVSGAWVTTATAGAARLGGVTIPFPSGGGGPTYEALDFVDPPTLTTGNDSNQDYNMGIRFSSAAARLCYGIRWRVPDVLAGGAPNGGSWIASLWTTVGEIRVASKVFTPVAGSTQDILFDSPYALTALPELYVAAIFTRDYTFRPSAGIDRQSPSGNIVGDQGKLAASGNPLTFPSSTFAAYYYISPLVGV
jgi:hypothetical protein